MCDMDEAEFAEYLRWLEAAAAERARGESPLRRARLDTPVAPDPVPAEA
ncbi:MAG TPA: hypothetical protein VMG99_05045 [Thermoplasmata archaeon]|nr:hypothetical protein [Thermoplasmata archaeon]